MWYRHGRRIFFSHATSRSKLLLCSWRFMIHCWPHVDDVFCFCLRRFPDVLECRCHKVISALSSECQRGENFKHVQVNDKSNHESLRKVATHNTKHTSHTTHQTPHNTQHLYKFFPEWSEQFAYQRMGQRPWTLALRVSKLCVQRESRLNKWSLSWWLRKAWKKWREEENNRKVVKREIYMCEERKTHVWRERRMCEKRDTHMCEERETHLLPDGHLPSLCHSWL